MNPYQQDHMQSYQDRQGVILPYWFWWTIFPPRPPWQPGPPRPPGPPWQPGPPRPPGSPWQPGPPRPPYGPRPR